MVQWTSLLIGLSIGGYLFIPRPLKKAIFYGTFILSFAGVINYPLKIIFFSFILLKTE